MSLPESGANLNPLLPGASPLVDPLFDSSIEESTSSATTPNTAASTSLLSNSPTDTLALAAATGPTEALTLLGPAGSPLLAPPSSDMSLLSYARTVNDPVIEFRKLANLNSSQDYLLNRLADFESAATAATLIRLFLDIDAYSRAARLTNTIANNNIDNLNQARDVLNTEVQTNKPDDQAAIDALNQAIQDYNNGVIDQDQYNEAVATYQAYFDGRNPTLTDAETTYNDQVDTYNQQVDALNAQIDENNKLATKLGLPLTPHIPYANHATNIQLPPAQTVPPATIPIDTVLDRPAPLGHLASIPPPPTNTTLMQTIYQPSQEAAMTSLAALQDIQDLNAAYILLINYYLAGKVPYLANAFINKNPVTAAGTAATAASGSSLNGMVLGLQSGGIERVLSLGQYKLDTLQTSRSIPPRVFDLINANTVNLLGKVGLFASLPATNILGEKLNLIPPESPVVGLSVGFGFLKGLVGAISSDGFKNDLQGFINNALSEAGLTGQGLIDTTNVLTSSTTMALLQIGLVQAALSLQSPGLVSQFLANVEGLPEGAAVLASSSNGTQLNDVIQNPLSLAQISSSVAARFGGGIDEATISKALGNVLAESNTNNPSVLAGPLSQEFQQQGLSTQQADVLSQLAVAELTGSANLPFLQAALGGGLDVANLPIGSLTSQLNGGENGTVVEQAVRNSLNQVTSPSAFQLSLENELQKAGITPEKAGTISRAITLGLAEASFKAAFDSNMLNQELLAISLEQTLKNKLKAGIGAIVSEIVLKRHDINSLQELRKAISDELQQRGLAASDSSIVSNSVIIDLRNSGQNPLEALGLGTVLGPQALREKIFTRISGMASPDLGSDVSKELASNYTLALLGVRTEGELTDKEAALPASVLSLFNRQIAELKSENQNELLNKWSASLRDLTNPTLELVHLLSRVQEPAKVLLSTAVPQMGNQQIKLPISSIMG